MENKNNLTTGSVPKTLVKFALPFLLACFLQTFYGMVDMYVAGRYNGSETTTAVSIGSQIMHMFTVMIVGLLMGTTVMISRAFGSKNSEEMSKTIGNSVTVFAILSLMLCVILIACINPIIRILAVPTESVQQTRNYLLICFAGIPFIVAYNVLGSIFRGIGDSVTPLITPLYSSPI